MKLAQQLREITDANSNADDQKFIESAYERLSCFCHRVASTGDCSIFIGGKEKTYCFAQYFDNLFKEEVEDLKQTICIPDDMDDDYLWNKLLSKLQAEGFFTEEMEENFNEDEDGIVNELINLHEDYCVFISW